jgi:hypothetical protein
MNKIFNKYWLIILFLGAFSLTFTSCEEDDDENNTGGQTELLSYGPIPIARGAELQIIGNNLDKVNTVVVPENINIEAGDFNKQTTDLITVTIPQTAEEGKLKLITAEDTLISKTRIGYLEPISLDEFSPDAIKPGEVLTISGEYLNLIKEVVFSDGVIADTAYFEAQSRKELKVIVPEKAQTGEIGITSINDNDEKVTIFSESELDVTLPAITGVSPATVKAGETLTISGTDLDLVKEIKYGGDVITDSLVSVNAEGDELVAYVPENARDGSVSVIPASGVEVTAEVAAIEMLVPTFTAFGENPVKPGSKLTVTGEDLDLVSQVNFGEVTQTDITVISETEIEFIVPVEAPGGIVDFVTLAGKVVPSDNPLSMILPTINGIQPSAAPAGDFIKLGGENLDLVASVTFTGGINVETSYDEENDSVAVEVPNGALDGPLTVVSKNGDEVVTTQNFTFVSMNVPEVSNVSGGVMPGDMLVIEGEKLNLFTDVIFPGDITATMFGTKSETLLEVYVPSNVTLGDGKVTFITNTGEQSQSPVITFGLDPVTSETVILNDYEQHGDHNGYWDASWSVASEILVEDENTFIKLTEATSGNGDWIINCNHQSSGAPGPVINNIEDYVIKVDVRTDEGVTVSSTAQYQFIFGGGWNWYGEGLLPETTNGAWRTITVLPSELGLSGTLDMSSGDNGLAGGPVPAGVSFDNLRFDLK